MFGANRPDVLLPTEARVIPKQLPPAGRIGLQTWLSSAEFKDIRVTRGAETLYQFDPAKQLDGWSPAAEGKWEVVDGALRQSNTEVNKTNISIGDPGWQDYNVRLKARKLDGAEGFIVRLRDQNSRFVHVNFGGWSNSAHGIEQNSPNPIVQKHGSIETGRWYDVEISLAGDSISASLDGVKIFENVSVPSAAAPKVEIVSGYDKKTGEIVVKCVNPGTETTALQLNLTGASVPVQKARRITLTGEPTAINDLAQPSRIAPVEDTIAVSGPEVTIGLNPSSLTILRCKAKLPK
jgi:alpha-L-arabinofuranosidase